MKPVFACLKLVVAIAIVSGCGSVQEEAQQGAAEGAMSVLGQLAIEEAADVKLTAPMECAAEAEGDNGTPIECTGQTEDGKKASINGTVTSADAEKGVVKGALTLTYDGKEIGKKDCVGVC